MTSWEWVVDVFYFIGFSITSVSLPPSLPGRRRVEAATEESHLSPVTGNEQKGESARQFSPSLKALGEEIKKRRPVKGSSHLLFCVHPWFF